jgi:lambda family phage tail tape measure protein
MAVEKTAIEISAIDNATRTFNQVGAAAKNLEKGYASLKSTFEAAVGALAIDRIVEETIRWEQASFRLNATLKATGNAVGLTRHEMDELVQTLSRATPFDETDLRNAEANLVKFGNIHEDVFKDALKLSADYAAFTGGTVAEASQKLGRALQDPVMGLRTLRDVIGNLTFTEKEYIAQLEAGGKTQEAQLVLIEKLRSAIGGTGPKANTGLTGQVGLLRKAWDELGEAVGHGIANIESGIAAAGNALDKSGLGNASSRFVGPPGPPPELSWDEQYAQQQAKIAAIVAKGAEAEDRLREARAKAIPVVQQWNRLLQDQTNEQRALTFVLEGEGRTLGDVYKAQILNIAVEKDWREVYKVRMDLAARYAAALRDETMSEEENLATRIKVTQDQWMTGTRDAFQEYIKHAKDGAEQAQFFFRNAFRNMEDALVSFAMTGKLNFHDLANSIVADLIRIQIRQQLAGFASNSGLVDALGTLGPALGVNTPGVDLGVNFHSGGVVGSGGQHRQVNPAWFAKAPRMHMGGLAGDEVPAILQRGERVIPRGGSAGTSVVVHNHIGGDVSADTLARVAAATRQAAMQGVAEERRRNPHGAFGG